ncbi:MAG: serine/threonine-protein kinase [Solirubrobacteraceae bacterium]
MRALFAGSEFAGYRIDAVIGRGGMGVIYRATESRPERVVAIKVVAPELADDVAFRARFLRESQVAASIEHPHVVPVLRVGEEDDLLYIAMRFIRGENLAETINRDAPLDPLRAVRIVDQLADALDTAHEQGLVHRDVKPANVLVESRRRGDHVYLTDFGLTKYMMTKVSLTGTGMAVGTTDYMAPEQWQDGAIDRRVDVYSLGCVLFEMLTGRVPFAQEGQAARMYAHLTLPPPRVTEVVPDAPAEFDEVVSRAMAKSPDERYPTAGALGAAALAAARGATEETKLALPVPPVPPVRIPEETKPSPRQDVEETKPSPRQDVAATAVRLPTPPGPDRPGRAAPGPTVRDSGRRPWLTALVVAIFALALAIAGTAAAILISRSHSSSSNQHTNPAAHNGGGGGSSQNQGGGSSQNQGGGSSQNQGSGSGGQPPTNPVVTKQCSPGVTATQLVSCRLASNTFYEYYLARETGRDTSSLRAWSHKAGRYYSERCSTGAVLITCFISGTSDPHALVQITQAAMDAYTPQNARSYASHADVGPYG